MDTDRNGNREQKQRPKKRQRLRFWFSVAGGAVLAIVILGLILLPFAVEWAAERYLVNAGAREAYITNVDLNLLTGRFAIVGLQVEGANGDRISLETFEADADILQLVKKRVRISNVALAGFAADIRQLEDGTIMVGGLKAQASTNRSEIPEDKEPTSWGFGIGTVDLYNLETRFTGPDLEETITINRFHLSDFATWAPEDPTTLLVGASVLGAGIQLEGTANPLAASPVADLRYNISELPLDRLNPYLEKNGPITMNGIVNISGDLGMSLPPGTRNLDLKISMTSGQVSAALNREPGPLLWRHENLSFEVKGSYSDTGTVSPDNLATGVKLDIDGIHVLADGRVEDLLSIGSIELKDLETQGTGQITVDQVSMDDIVLLSRSEKVVGEKEPSEVVRLSSLKMAGIGLENGNLLNVEDVSLDSLLVWILRGEGGDLEPMTLLSGFSREMQDAPEEQQDIDEDTPEPAMEITVGRVSLSGKNNFTFRDLDVKPPMTFQVDSLELQVSDLDTNPSKGHADITLEAGIGKYSSFHVDGSVNAPWSEPDVNLKVKLQTLDLPPLTPYTDRYVGYILKSGHLNTDLDITISEGKLNVQTEVVVNRIEMNPVKEEDEQQANERLGIPVQTALSLLKDKNDDIKLTLPIEGDLNDPEFKISDVVLKVTGNALKKGVSAFYGPLGATILTGGLLPPGTFSVLGKVFEGATTVSFDPVVFKPMESGLSGEHRLFLDQLAAKLQEKPGTRLILCGKVTRQDIVDMRNRDFAAIQAAGSPAPAGTGPAQTIQAQVPMAAGIGTAGAGTAFQASPAGPPSIEESPLTDEEKERLVELAKQRALAVKDYLIEAGGLDQERLFVCYSDVEKKEEGPPPRVDLSI
jgi:hypothetical protein